MSACECLECKERFTCDFALSAWAAKARMMDKGIKVRFMTYNCSKKVIIEPEVSHTKIPVPTLCCKTCGSNQVIYKGMAESTLHTDGYDIISMHCLKCENNFSIKKWMGSAEWEYSNE